MINSYAARWLLEDCPDKNVDAFWSHVDTTHTIPVWDWREQRGRECLAATGQGKRCSASTRWAPFCERHLERARDWFRMLDLYEEVRAAVGPSVNDIASTIATAQWIVNQHREDLVYFWEIEGAGVVKIGHSKQVDTRVAIFRNGKGCTFPPNVDPSRGHLLGTSPGGHSLERALHIKYRRLWVTGEWFRLDEELATEITSLTTDTPLLQSA